MTIRHEPDGMETTLTRREVMAARNADRIGERVRATHAEQAAAITDAELRAGDDLIINPAPIDWVAVRGSWSGYAVLYGITFGDIYPDLEGDVIP
jgi:hypothetical protein